MHAESHQFWKRDTHQLTQHMFRYYHARRAALPNFLDTPLQVEVKHLLSFCVPVGLTILYVREKMKADTAKFELTMKDGMKKLESSIKIDIDGLRQEVRAALGALHISQGHLQAHGQLFRDANAAKFK